MAITSLNALKRAVKIAGGQTALGRACGKKQQHVWNWLNKSRRVPAEDVLAVEAATGVSRHDLRPDIYPQR
jgi:DNA-binding transcriptional regulator YdaS (Cro superfamily)